MVVTGYALVVIMLTELFIAMRVPENVFINKTTILSCCEFMGGIG